MGETMTNEKILNWYNNFCYKNKIDSDLFDINAEIDSAISEEENITILEEKLNILKANGTLLKKEYEKTKTEQLEYKSDSIELNIKKWLLDSISKSKVYAVIGSRGSGKSLLAYSLLECHHKISDRKCYVYKFPKPYLLPDFIKSVNDIYECEKGGVLLIDEAGIEFNQFSFNSKQSIDLANMLKVARHRDLSIFFIAQNGGNLTRDIRRLIDCYLLRNPSYTQMYDEISIIKRMYHNCFMLFSPEKAKREGFFISEIGELAFCNIPSFWNEQISKAYDGETKNCNIADILATIVKRKV